ncbi:head protein [Pseudomonas aeruginosa]|uniref:Mu-like prophage major head subunit gpT family protein n=1 Tax=Pseudomonas aeruginosa TaxID=287 RepID=UPI000B40F373|nr:Mu-like prophage major head subunit gpT family protein [Pseudomonas aeruginosa]OVZ27773.1 head protein [Pseudomonas aeruginosa]OVZ72241.1 head protein [Pseudomonas aeruginosa]
MIINAENLETLFTDLRAEYDAAFAASPSVWEKIAMKIPSNSGDNLYIWLKGFPKMRRWIGAKHVKNIEAENYQLINEDFEATISVLRKHVEDDKVGIYMPQSKMMGFAASQLPDELVFEAVNNGFTARCHDGRYFFDTDHSVGGQSVSNKGSAPISNANLAEAEAGFGAAKLAMRSLKDEEGLPLNVTPTTLLVGPALEDTARLLLSNDKLADGSPNPYKGAAELLVDGRVESPTAWYLLDTSKPILPFIYQPRSEPEFVAQVSDESVSVFYLNEYKFGVEARGTSGYGFWQLAYGSTGIGG